MSLEILPIWRAELCKVGEGRNEPNINPYLPPPTGRFEWSINPFKMFVNKSHYFRTNWLVLELELNYIVPAV